MKAGKIITWIIVLAIAVVIIVIAYKLFNENVVPQIADPTGSGQSTGALKDNSEVVITFDDDLYHRPGCADIRGPSEKVVYRTIKDRDDLVPCPMCIGR